MKRKILLLLAMVISALCICTGCYPSNDEEHYEMLKNAYQPNEEITGAYDESLAVDCVNGTFVGKRLEEENKAVVAYKGIPYAKQPVGDLRWKAPEAAEPSDKVYEAYYFGKSPIQTEWFSEEGSFYQQGEECLNLNVWVNTEEKSSSPKPVMVFIHGGAFGWGATADPCYDGANFIRDNGDVILVTIGYRIGVTGFVDFSEVPGGEAYPDAGSLGMQDQVAALQWVQENIAGFGGDPDNVTIFGESAGGASVSLLAIMPEAEGLFDRIIAESGSINLSWPKDESLDFAQSLLASSGATNMDELMALSEEDLMAANLPINDYNNYPERDGIHVPTDVYACYEKGDSTDYDILLGTNADEFNYWIGELGGLAMYRFSLNVAYENYYNKASAEDQAKLDAYVERLVAAAGTDEEDPLLDLHQGEVWARAQIITEMDFRQPAIYQAENHSRNGGTAYMYYWKYPSNSAYYGACHAVELSSVFNSPESSLYTGGAYDEQLARTVQRMWVNFAKTGNPSITKADVEKYDLDASVYWPEYTEKDRSTMVLDAGGCEVVEDPVAEGREAVSPMVKYDINGNGNTRTYDVPTVKKVLVAGAGMAIFVILFLIGIIRRCRRARKARKAA